MLYKVVKDPCYDKATEHRTMALKEFNPIVPGLVEYYIGQSAACTSV